MINNKNGVNKLTPSEFKQLKDLRLVDDQGLMPEMLMLLDTDTESVSVLLSQLKSYILGDIENSLNPVGSPIPWPNDNIPMGYAKINDGLTFDIIKFPRTALAWPSGLIPPHKGLVIECTADGAVTADTEQGEIKKHSHTGVKTIINTKHLHSGSATGGDHEHGLVGVGTTIKQSGNSDMSAITSGGSQRKTTRSGSLTLSVKTNESGGEFDVTNNVNLTGAPRNTVDRINYNMIVRLA